MSRDKRRQKAKGKGKSREAAQGFSLLALTACCLLFFTACRQDMQDQPRYEAYEESKFSRMVCRRARSSRDCAARLPAR